MVKNRLDIAIKNVTDELDKPRGPEGVRYDVPALCALISVLQRCLGILDVLVRFELSCVNEKTIDYMKKLTPLNKLSPNDYSKLEEEINNYLPKLQRFQIMIGEEIFPTVEFMKLDQLLKVIEQYKTDRLVFRKIDNYFRAKNCQIILDKTNILSVVKSWEHINYMLTINEKIRKDFDRFYSNYYSGAAPQLKKQLSNLVKAISYLSKQLDEPRFAMGVVGYFKKQIVGYITSATEHMSGFFNQIETEIYQHFGKVNLVADKIVTIQTVDKVGQSMLNNAKNKNDGKPLKSAESRVKGKVKKMFNSFRTNRNSTSKTKS